MKIRMVLGATAVTCGLALGFGVAHAEIDGHGPDAWRVTGVASDDVLNARMGPGTEYKVIEHFAPNERGMQQVTCVPYYTLGHFSSMTEAERNALPSRWCLMRSQDLTKAGWVAQRFITPDDVEMVADPVAADPVDDVSGDPLIMGAADLVRDLYRSFDNMRSEADNPFSAANAHRYFFADLVPQVQGRGGDLLYDAQDFDGEVTRIAPDPDQPMFRGMITINADFTNFGQRKQAVFHLRADTDQPDAPFRIFSISHDEWGFPD